ncbi:MAG: AMP-binding protein, partial [Glutamicibacter arilaitensis]
MSVTDEFRAARDRLLELREDYETAREDFRWPELSEFNFGFDWFDQVAKDPQRADAPALIITERDGSSTRRSWAELSQRSTQLARWLSDIGVRRGQTIAVMLGNQVELWESMLAGIKLGAILIPCTTQLTPTDLADRIERGHISWVITNQGEIQKFETVPGDYTLIQIGGSTTEGILDFAQSYNAEAEFQLDSPTRADETLLRYFTSGTTSKAK